MRSVPGARDSGERGWEEFAHVVTADNNCSANWLVPEYVSDVSSLTSDAVWYMENDRLDKGRQLTINRVRAHQAVSRYVADVGLG